MEVHHARVYSLSDRAAITVILNELKESHAVTQLERASWGINDSRALVGDIYKTESAGRTRVFAIITSDITFEAQNALLKIVEEPPAHSRLVFFLAPEVTLLPTLQSRVELVGGVEASAPSTTFKDWHDLSLAEQIATIETKLKKKDETWLDEVTRGAQAFLQAEHQHFDSKSAERLQFALLQLGTRGASNKMLLEEVALLLSSLTKKR